eukprot:1139704-Prymnesium_polylepis.2
MVEWDGTLGVRRGCVVHIFHWCLRGKRFLWVSRSPSTIEGRKALPLGTSPPLPGFGGFTGSPTEDLHSGRGVGPALCALRTSR